MLRRKFVQKLLQVLAGTAMTPALRASPRRLQLQTCALAGFQYHTGTAVWPMLAAGAPLSLVREPLNRYDERAVRVDWNGRILGYVPRLDNAAVAQIW